MHAKSLYKLHKAIIALFLLSALLINAGCGGAGESGTDYTAQPPETDAPDGNLADPENPELIPPGIPTPSGTQVPSSAYRGSTTVSDTENYQTEISVPSIALSFALLESSGGNYELEPVL